MAELAPAPPLSSAESDVVVRLAELKRLAIVPALNEEVSVGRVIDEIRAFDPGFEIAAPSPLSVVCFRARFAGSSPEEQDRRNAEMMEAVNATGEAYLSHTKLKGRTVLRLAVGNLRTEERHVRRAWERIQGAAARR